jgi:predicted dehydrogenase
MMATHRDIKVGIVGLGGMGMRHIESVQMANMKLIALCDLNARSIEKVTGSYAVKPKGYTDWQRLIEENCEELDILIVATNGPTHSSIVQFAARSKIPHILCEKPMATNGQAARDMKRVCDENNTVLAINFTRRHVDRYRRLKKALQEKVIGEVRHTNVVVGAGGLGCIGTHFFDLVMWLLDRPATWVMGQIDEKTPTNVRGRSFYDPGGKGIVGFGDGVTASFELSSEIPLAVMMQIIGTQGFITLDEWHQPGGGRIEIYKRPIEEYDTPPTRFVYPEITKFEVGEPIDVAKASLANLHNLVAEAPEETVAAGIASVDVVIGFHLSSMQDWGKIEIPLSGGQLLHDVPIT